MTKNTKIVLNLVILSLVILPLGISAFSVPGEPGATASDVGTVVSNIVDKVWIIFAAIAVILFVYAGVMFLTAAGSPEKIAAARQAAMWGVVGVVVMILAFSIFNIAQNLI